MFGYLTRLLNTEIGHLTRFLNIDVRYSKQGIEFHEYLFEDHKTRLNILNILLDIVNNKLDLHLIFMRFININLDIQQYLRYLIWGQDLRKYENRQVTL